jgi:hypothetical protein
MQRARGGFSGERLVPWADPERTGFSYDLCADQADLDVMPELEIRKPLPPVVQVTPVVADTQRKVPTPVAVP